MKYFLLFFSFFALFSAPLLAQSDSLALKKTYSSSLWPEGEAPRAWGWGQSILLEFSAYRWDQQRQEAISPQPQSIGQLLNILPGLHMSLWAGNRKSFLFSLEGGLSYYPFSLDIGPQKNAIRSTLAAPLMLKGHWLLDSSYKQNRRTPFKSFLSLGYGQEWVYLGHNVNGSNAKWLHIVELCRGSTVDSFSLQTFIKFGWGQKDALLAQLGIRLGWDGF
ncbi:hypothetical protein SapgrDRAFT_0177 [Saprospira grandis DSM 2844]|uniref:Uncharacterized protein n=1 Tax=Saprospira grandis DSM 2844 TaxID=694433 RepID=J0XSN8_9BACT|nr:hypothetical protein [Saprospira grandis]EJF51936.1 hypothetical protein SapgrDRAFT_0177 [Saprospira grandis DSM 2844]